MKKRNAVGGLTLSDFTACCRAAGIAAAGAGLRARAQARGAGPDAGVGTGLGSAGAGMGRGREDGARGPHGPSSEPTSRPWSTRLSGLRKGATTARCRETVSLTDGAGQAGPPRAGEQDEVRAYVALDTKTSPTGSKAYVKGSKL